MLKLCELHALVSHSLIVLYLLGPRKQSPFGEEVLVGLPSFKVVAKRLSAMDATKFDTG
jgi:hypothetical protein